MKPCLSEDVDCNCRTLRLRKRCSGAVAQFFEKSNLFIKTDVCFYSAIAIVGCITDGIQI